MVPLKGDLENLYAEWVGIQANAAKADRTADHHEEVRRGPRQPATEDGYNFVPYRIQLAFHQAMADFGFLRDVARVSKENEMA